MNKSKEILKKVSGKFFSDTFFVPVTGAEIEFYLHGDAPDNIIEIIAQKCFEAEIPVLDIQKEKGKGQYEIALTHNFSPLVTADNIAKTRVAINEMAAAIGLKADFSAKPFADDHGSSLQIHLSLFDKNSINVLMREDGDESEVMLYAVGGLMQLLPASMKYFAPTTDCYKRYVSKTDAPTTISWGGNNRTVALRLPATTMQEHNRRVEHRVPSAESDPYLVIACILAGASFGILNKIMPTCDKIYGDASLPQYNLKPLPLSLDAANLASDNYLDESFK